MCTKVPAWGRGLCCFVAVAGAALSPGAAIADDCMSAGRMSVMLVQIDQHCHRYQLSADGQKVKVATLLNASKLAPGGKGDACVVKARPGVLDEFATRTMARLVLEGDDEQFQAMLCEEIVTYLGQLASFAKRPKLYERK
jgi:hypothetical protein